MESKEYNIGDKVWWAKYQREEVKKNCPICFGKMKVRLILGDRSQVETDCTFCERGFQKYGWVSGYEYVSDVEQVEITHKEVNEGASGRNVEYHHGYYNLTLDDAFETKEEAEVALLKKIEKAKQEDLERLEYGKGQNPKSYSWHVGYYQRKKRQALKEIEQCDKKIKYFKSKVKSLPPPAVSGV